MERTLAVSVGLDVAHRALQHIRNLSITISSTITLAKRVLVHLWQAAPTGVEHGVRLAHQPAPQHVVHVHHCVYVPLHSASGPVRRPPRGRGSRAPRGTHQPPSPYTSQPVCNEGVGGSPPRGRQRWHRYACPLWRTPLRTLHPHNDAYVLDRETRGQQRRQARGHDNIIWLAVAQKDRRPTASARLGSIAKGAPHKEMYVEGCF